VPRERRPPVRIGPSPTAGTERTGRVNAARDVATSDRSIGVTDSCHRLRIRQHVDRLLEALQILGADQHRGRPAISGHDDTVVLCVAALEREPALADRVKAQLTFVLDEVDRRRRIRDVARAVGLPEADDG
jgi:hypothetical protein